MEKNRFLVSYIRNNQPESVEISINAEQLSIDEAFARIKATYGSAQAGHITDVQVIGIHHRNPSDVHPGHYQQPEGNDV